MIRKNFWLLLSFIVFAFCGLPVRAADAPVDYLEPKTLTGTIYADASLKQALFTFTRTATNSGSSIHVLREFSLPNGKVAAREHVVYERGQLKSFMLEELQTGAKGNVAVQPEGGDMKMNFTYTEGSTRKTGNEKFLKEILVSDMVGPFIVSHWDALLGGATVKCRLVSVSRAETVGFKFSKESEMMWHGKPVVVMRLDPSSIIIAQLVAPLHFIMEKDAPHRVLQYTGRTTPSILRKGKWDELDAVTVFDWK